MADTTFVPGTLVTSSWLNQVNDRTYTDVINVQNAPYNAAGNGTTNDHTAVVAALTAAFAAGKPTTVYFPTGRYRIDAILGTFTGNDVTIDLNGSILDFSNLPTSPGVTLLNFTGVYSGALKPLTADAASGQKTVSVNSSGIAVGNAVRIYSEAVFDSLRTGSKYGELSNVETIPGGTSLTLTTELNLPYNTAASATLQVVTPMFRLHIKNGSIIGPAGNDNHVGIKLTLGEDCVIENVKSYDMDAIHMQAVDCVNCRVDGCHFQESNTTSTGYGVSFADAARDCLAVNNTFTNVRHSLSTNNSAGSYGIVRRITFANNNITDSATTLGLAGGDAVDTHAACDDILITGNVINSSSGSGINVEGRNAIISNNVITNVMDNGITYQNYTDLDGECTITGNVIRAVFGNYGIAVIPNSTKITNTVVSDNNVKVAAVPLYLVGTTTKTFDNITVAGNSLLNTAGNIGIRLDYGVNGTITGNSIETGSVGVQLDTCIGIAVTGNSVNLTASGTIGYGVRIQGTSTACNVTGNGLYQTGTLSASAAVSFINTTVTYSACYSNVGRGFTAGTVFNVGTGTGNLAANNLS